MTGDPEPVRPVPPAPTASVPHGRSIALTILACLAVIWTLHFARVLLAPIVLASMLQFVLFPVVRRLNRLGVPQVLGASLVLAVFVAAASAAMWRLSGPALDWLEQIPSALRRSDERIAALKAPVETIAEAAERLASLTRLEGEDRGMPVEAAENNKELVVGAGSLLSGGVITAFLLFFMLASSGSFLRSLVQILPVLGDKKLAVSLVRTVEGEVTRYLTTITVINALLGVAVGLWTYALGMPSPVLWGALAATLNFVPYAGTAVGIAIVGLVAFVSIEELTPALLAPSGYLVLSGLEGMLLTPAVLGTRMRIRPVIVLLWLLVWAFLWGILGVLLAVPLLVVAKILCDHLPRLRPIGVLLGRDVEPDERREMRALAQRDA